jgi:uncharacterized protein YycO
MKRKILRTLLVVIMITTIFICALFISMAVVEPDAHIYPDYPRVDLAPVLSKDSFEDKDYFTLYCQTGLGRPAVDEIKELYEDWRQRILKFQEDFWKEVRFTCEKNSPISREESIVDEHGNYISGIDMAPLHEGYILVTKASHTYGWRNGHSALIVDADNGKTLESVVLGRNSSIQDINKWTNYPNFILLRPKGATYEQMREISFTAVKLLYDIPYDLTVGIFSPKSADMDKISGTHCSHLIWQAYRYHGYDLDSDGGMIVTPKDIAASPDLEIVQVYGANPLNIWP